MLKGIVSRTLTSILDEFMKPVKSRQMKMDILKGITEIRDLELQEKAFEKVGVGLLVEKGLISRLYLNFPWTKLESAPTIVQIEDIHVSLKVDWDYFVQSSDEMTSQKVRGQNKQKDIDNLKQALGFLDKFVDNLYVLVKNIYISITVPTDAGSSTIGFVLPEFKIESSNQMKLGDRSFFSKIISITGMYMFMDANIQNIPLESPLEFVKFFEKSQRQIILDYPHIEVFYSHYRDTLTPIMNSIECNFNEVVFQLTQEQIKQISLISVLLSKSLCRQKYVECVRPTNLNDEEKMLFYAMRCASVQQGRKYFSAKIALEFLKNRREYYNLYKKSLDQNIFTRKSAKKFDCFITNLSKSSKILLLQYAKARRRVELSIKVNQLTEEEKRELQKQSEGFMSTLNSFQMFGIINKINIKLLNNDKTDFANLEILNYSVRGFISDVLHQYSISLQDINIDIQNNKFMTAVHKLSTWMTLTFSYGQDLATIQGRTGQLIFNFDKVLDFLRYLDGNAFKFKFIDVNMIPFVINVYHLKKWDMTFDMETISFELDKLKIQTNFSLMNDDKQKSRKDEDIFLSIFSSLNIINDEFVCLEKMNTDVVFKSKLVNREFLVSDLTCKLMNLNLTIDDKLLEFVFNYTNSILQCLHVQRLDDIILKSFMTIVERNNKQFNLFLPLFSYEINQVKNNVKTLSKKNFLRDLFDPQSLLMKLDFKVCEFFVLKDFICQINHSIMSVNIGKIAITAFPNIIDFIPVQIQKQITETIRRTSIDNLLDSDLIKDLEKSDQTEQSILGEVNDNTKCFIAEEIQENKWNPKKKFDISFLPKFETKISEFFLEWKNNENNAVYCDILLPNIKMSCIPKSLAFSMCLPEINVFSGQEKSVSIQQIKMFTTLSTYDRIWTMKKDDIYDFNFDTNDKNGFLDKITVFIDVSDVNVVYDHLTAKSYVSFLNEMMPSIEKLMPKEFDVKSNIPVDLNFGLNKFQMNLKEIDFGVLTNDVTFSIHGKEIGSEVKSFQILQNKIKSKVITHPDEYLVKIETIEKVPNITLNTITFILHPAVFTPLLVYLWRTPFWKLKIPKVKANVDYNFVGKLTADSIRVLLPSQVDLGMSDEVLSVYLSAKMAADENSIDVKSIVRDVRFVSLTKNFEFPQIIDHLSCFALIRQPNYLAHIIKKSKAIDRSDSVEIDSDDNELPKSDSPITKSKSTFEITKTEKNEKPIPESKSYDANLKNKNNDLEEYLGVKTVSFGIDDDVNFSFSPEDVYGVYSILKDWLSVQLPAMNLQMPKASPPPCLFVTTKDIKIRICHSNRNSSKEQATIIIYMPPVDIAASNSNERTTFVLQTKFGVNHFNSCTGNIDSIVNETELILSYTSTDDKVDIVSLIDSPCTISLSYHFIRELKSLIEVAVEPRHSHNIIQNPDYWLKSTCFDEIIVSVTDASTLFLFPGDLIPAFFITANSFIIVTINNKSKKFRATDILYPISLSENVVIAKHPYNGGMMLEFASKYSMKNDLSFDLYIYVKTNSGFVFLCVLPRHEIRSLLPYSGTYFFASSKRMPTNKPHLTILGPKETTNKCDVYSDENYVPCTISKEKSDIFGFDILSITEEFTLKNLVPYAMHYNINNQKFLANYGETIPIPNFGSKNYVSITASYDDTNYPTYDWLYFTGKDIQYIPAYVCKNISLFCVIEDKTLIVYSPVVLFNSTSNQLKIENEIIPPGNFTLWSFKTQKLISLEIFQKTKQLKNAIDPSIAGVCDELFLQSSSNDLYYSLRYKSERQSNDFYRTIAITITDGIRVDNKLDYGITLIPKCQVSDSDLMSFFIPPQTMKIFNITSKEKKYSLGIGVDKSERTIVLTKPLPKTVFRMKRDGNLEFIEIEVKDELTSLFVTFRKVYQSRFIISNDLTIPFYFYQENEDEKVLVQPNSFEDFAYEEPFGPKQIYFILQENKFCISLDDTNRQIMLSKSFDHRKVFIVIKYVKGQCRISLVNEGIQKDNLVKSGQFQLSINSIYFSIIDDLFREILCANFNLIDLLSEMKDDFISLRLKIDSMTVDDQNETSPHPAIIRSENRTFFDLHFIFQTDVLQSHEILYISMIMQPLHVYVVPQFLSDVYSFFLSLDIEKDLMSIVSPARSSFGISNEIKIAWADIFPLDIYLSITNADKYVQRYPFQSIFRPFISLSERRLSLPAFFLTEFNGSLQEIANELTFVYAVNGLDFLLSNMGTLGTLLKWVGVVGRVRSKLNIKHDKFRNLPIELHTEHEYDNRVTWFGCFNNYTIQNVFVIQNNFNVTESLLSKILNSPTKEITACIINTKAVIGSIVAHPRVNNQSVTMFRRRLPLCCLTNSVTNYNEKISRCQQILIEKKLGRPMFFGKMVGKKDYLVFVTIDYVCCLSPDFLVEWSCPVLGVESILNDGNVITMHYARETRVFESDHAGAIVLFISAS